MIKTLTAVFATFAAFAAAIVPAHARDAEVYTGLFSSLAVGGYDTVAYFKVNRPVKGKAEFSMQYKGATWQFASAENLNAFRANPAAYAPQYGGYCAFGMSEGRAVPGDPRVFTVIDGRLYLGTDADALRRWSEDVAANAARADRNWERMLEK